MTFDGAINLEGFFVAIGNSPSISLTSLWQFCDDLERFNAIIKPFTVFTEETQ